jgi:hypothetical protein
MEEAGMEWTLDNWLTCNFLDPGDPPDAELLEVIPDIFHEEYCDRLRFWAEYEQKFERVRERACSTSGTAKDSSRSMQPHRNKPRRDAEARR